MENSNATRDANADRRFNGQRAGEFQGVRAVFCDYYNDGHKECLKGRNELLLPKLA
jgi:hypothetical protein